MSIIADTLNRLQTSSPQIQSRQSETSQRSGHQHDGPLPPHKMAMPSKQFLLVALGLSVGISSIGVVGFWIGWNLDLGPSASTTSPTIREEKQPIVLASPTNIPEADQPLALNSLPEMSRSPTVNKPLIIVKAPSDSPILLTQPGQAEKTMPNTESTPLAPTSTPAKKPNASQPTPSSTSPEMMNPPHLQPVDKPVAVPMTSPVTLTTAPDSSNSERSETEAVVTTHHSEKDPNPSPNLSSSSFKVEGPLQGTTDDLSETTEPATALLLEEKIIEETLSSNQTLEATPSFLPKSLEAASETGSTPQATQARTPPPVLPENSLRQGRYLIRAGQYEEALAVLSTLFKNPPEDWEPWFWMGTAYLGKGDLDQADQYFLSGLARNDKVPQMWIQRALVAQQRGEYQLAIHELRQAESLQPDLPHLHLNMGYAYDQLGNKRLANQYYGKFMQFSEGNPDFFSTRKKILDRLTQASPSKIP